MKESKGEQTSKKVIVLFSIKNSQQFFTEMPKILNYGGADGMILTNLFKSNIHFKSPYPNMVQFLEIAKERNPEKEIGVEVNGTEHGYGRLFEIAGIAKEKFPFKSIGVEVEDSKNIFTSEHVITESSKRKLDKLWCRHEGTTVDRLNPNSVIIQSKDMYTLPDLETVRNTKESLMPQQSLVLVGDFSVENVDQYIEYFDTVVIYNSFVTDGSHSYDSKKIKTFCQMVKGTLPSSVPATS